MKKELRNLILGIYIAISISICGYLYINPVITETSEKASFNGVQFYTIDYTHFKYSVLISIVIGILLYTFLQYYKSKSNN